MDGDGSSNNARGEAEPTYCPRFTASPVQMDESEDGDGPRWQFVGSGGQLITGAIAAPPRDGQDMGNGGQGVVQYFDDHHLDGADGRLSLPPIGGPYTINDHQSMAPLLTGSEPLYVLGGGYGKRAIVHNVRITPGGRRGGYYYVHMERGQFPPHVTASLSLLHEEQQGQNHPELQVEGMNPLVSGAQSNQAQQTPDQDHHEPRMPTTAEASGTSSTQGQQAHSPTPASGPGTSLEERGMLGATPVFDESIRQIALFPQGRSRIVVLCRDETLYSVSFKVSSTLMFFEACGWIAFLDSGPDSTATFKVQQQGGVRAMAIVLHLIHRLDVYHPVPAQLPLTTLGYVVAITEAFRCKEILDVFGPQWLAPFHDLGVSYKLHDRHDHGWLLYLALQSRDQPLFASLARFIQNHHTIDADADFLCGCGQKLTAHVPDDLGILEKVTPRLEEFKELRKKLVGAMLEKISTFVQRISQPELSQPCHDSHFPIGRPEQEPYCTQCKHLRAYRGMAHDFFIHTLRDRGFWPLPHPDTIHSSAINMFQRVRGVLHLQSDETGRWAPDGQRPFTPMDFVNELLAVVQAVEVPNVRGSVNRTGDNVNDS